MAQVILKPLDTETWHNKKGKDKFSAGKVTEVLYNGEMGGYDTGLTKEEAKEYGEKLGVDLSNTFNQEEPHPFWGSKAGAIELPNNTKVFDSEKARDFVKIKAMKRSPKIANSLKEYNEGRWPKATHYIYDEIEEADIEATKVSKRQKAFVASMEMGVGSKVSILMILTGKNYKGKSDNIINVEIARLITDNTDEFLKYYDMGAAEVTLRAQMLDMIARNILVKDGSAVYYMSDQIGYDTDAAIDYLKKPENQKLKIVLLERLEKLQ